MQTYGPAYRLSRFLLRLFCPTYSVRPQENLMEPAVYLCRHYNSGGIFMTLPWLKGRIRTWSLHLYHDRQACYQHMMNFTLTARFGWPIWCARPAARVIAAFLERLMHAGKAIPVYRNSMQILRTYQLSLAALKQGESIMIFPDRDYTSTSAEVGDLYDGFLMLDRLYFRDTGQHIAFIPLYPDPATRILHVGEAIIFQGDIRDKTERARVSEAIRQRLSGGSDSGDVTPASLA